MLSAILYPVLAAGSFSWDHYLFIASLFAQNCAHYKVPPTLFFLLGWDKEKQQKESAGSVGS